MTKCVQEFNIKFYLTFLDAVLDTNYRTIKIEIENNTLPSSLNIELDGEIKNFRLKPFQRQSAKGNFLENVYIWCH